MNAWDPGNAAAYSAWVGYWPVTGWYGGCGFDAEPIEDMAEADGATPEACAASLVLLMREYRDRVDRERAEWAQEMAR